MEKVLDNRTWATWSNVAYFVPLFGAAYFGDTYLTSLVGGTVLSSFLYHTYKPDGVDWWWRKGKSFKQKLFQWLDTGFAVATIVYLIDILWDKPITVLTDVMLVVAAIGIYFLFYPSDEYEEHHGIWHVIGAIAIALTLFL